MRKSVLGLALLGAVSLGGCGAMTSAQVGTTANNDVQAGATAVAQAIDPVQSIIAGVESLWNIGTSLVSALSPTPGAAAATTTTVAPAAAPSPAPASSTN